MMETTSKPTNLKLEEELKEAAAALERVGPGRIGVYERPARTGGSILVAIFVGFVALIIVAVTIYVQIFML
jgi:hypothetical protein